MRFGVRLKDWSSLDEGRREFRGELVRCQESHKCKVLMGVR